MIGLPKFDFRHAFKLLLVIVPVLIWDAFFYVVESFYKICVIIDDKGGRAVQKFMEK